MNTEEAAAALGVTQAVLLEVCEQAYDAWSACDPNSSDYEGCMEDADDEVATLREEAGIEDVAVPGGHASYRDVFTLYYSTVFKPQRKLRGAISE